MALSKSEAGKLGAIKTNIIRANKKIKLEETYNLNPNFCTHCKLAIPYNKRTYKYCSSSCAASVTGKLFPKRKASKLQKCLSCNKETSNAKYCSISCNLNYRKLLKTESIINGTASSGIVKNYLLELGHVCNKCKNSEWLGQPITLEFEHKDGHHTNNRLDNVELLCPNCHSQTPTFKAKNRGNSTRTNRYVTSAYS